MDPELRGFAESFRRFIERMTELAHASAGPSGLRARLDAHLGGEASGLPVVVEEFAPYDHANVQVGLSAYLEAPGRRHELLGLTGPGRHHLSFADLLEQPYGIGLGSVDLVNLPIGPDETLACVRFGIYLVADAGTPLAIVVRGPQEEFGLGSVRLEVLCRDPGHARRLLAEVRRLMVERNVFRGQVISFGESRMGHVTLGPVVFHRRPELGRDAVVLAEGALEAVERHVLGIARLRDRLRASRQHVKRGLLLHGPPGCGKTLTVRYLLAQTPGHTVVLLTGGGLEMLRGACALARLLQPSVVVLEDVDLVARDRDVFTKEQPLLFDLLNELDGIEEDADVAFVLTTNRADLVEPALAARPGRVDLAVEVGLPDARGRRRLIELYGRGLDLRLTDPDRVVARTEGVAASFIKELMRRAAVLSAEAMGGAGPITVTDEHVHAALDELLGSASGIGRALLGGPRRGDVGPGERPGPGRPARPGRGEEG
ncbi:MAG TPA: AAA family ATPase [Actinomycetota bacterium]|nr:AAA family ATPase [Actinomycetota bacterium]